MHENKMKQIENRQCWMDILNITAIIGVVLLHCNGDIFEFRGDVTSTFVWQAFVVSAFYWPVNVFFMITGANLIGYSKGWKQYASRRCERTVVPYFAWSLIYCILLHRDITSTEFVEKILTGKMIVFFWFFIALFVVYASIPFLTKMIQNSSKKTIEVFLLLSIVSSCIIPLLSVVGVEIKLQLFPMGGGYIFITLLGWYLVHIYKKKIRLFRLYQLGGVILVTNFALMLIYAQKCGRLSDILMSYHNPFCVVMAVLVFLLFKNINWERVFIKCSLDKEKVTFISSCTLGIYIVHPIVFSIGDHVGIGLFRNDYIGFFFTYTASLFLVILLKRIPLVKKLVP